MLCASPSEPARPDPASSSTATGSTSSSSSRSRSVERAVAVLGSPSARRDERVEQAGRRAAGSIGIDASSRRISSASRPPRPLVAGAGTASRQQVARDGGRGRVVEDQRGRQPQAGGLGEPVAQLDRGERVEAELLERALGVDRVRPRRARAPPRPGPATSSSATRSRSASATPASRCASDAAPPRRRRGRRADQPAQQRRQHPGSGPAPRSAAEVEPDRHEQRLRPARAPGRSSSRPSSADSAPTPIRSSRASSASPSSPVIPVASAHSPQASDVAGQPGRAPALRRARRGRRWPPRSCPGPGCRQRRRPRRTARTPPAPVPRSARAGAAPRRPSARSTAVQPLRGQRLDHAVVEHAGGVDDRGQRVLQRRRAAPASCVAVGDVAGGDPDLGAQLAPARRPARPRPARRAAAADQQQAPDAVLAGQVAGDAARPDRRCRR